MVYVLADLYDAYALVDDKTRDIAEFHGDEVGLLNSFVNVIGYDSGYIREGISIVHSPHSGSVFNSWIFSKGQYFQEEIEELKARGYLFIDYADTVVDELFERLSNPRLALAFGIHALVTDCGRLLYINTRGRSRVVLGDFCRVVCADSFSNKCAYTLFVVDDRIQKFSSNFCVDIWNKYNFDISGLSNSSVIWTLRELEEKGYVNLIR